MTQVFTGDRSPTVTTHPTSQLTNISMSVTLVCEGTGRGSITSQWETSNINGGQWMNISDSNNKTFVVRNLEQLQQHKCIVSNEASSNISNIARFTILGKLSAAIMHTFMYLTFDDNRNHHSSTEYSYCYNTRRCYVISYTAYFADVSYSWHHVNGSIPSKSIGHNNNNTFIIPRTIPYDEGSYYCVAKKDNFSMESNKAIISINGEN